MNTTHNNHNTTTPDQEAKLIKYLHEQMDINNPRARKTLKKDLFLISLHLASSEDRPLQQEASGMSVSLQQLFELIEVIE